MVWIKTEDELPIQGFPVFVKNGKQILWAFYYRKKWHYYGKKLYKVTEWEKSDVLYPKIPPKDMRAYLKRAKLYKHQIRMS